MTEQAISPLRRSPAQRGQRRRVLRATRFDPYRRAEAQIRPRTWRSMLPGGKSAAIAEGTAVPRALKSARMAAAGALAGIFIRGQCLKSERRSPFQPGNNFAVLVVPS